MTEGRSAEEFLLLLEPHRERLLVLSRSLVRRRADADDALQEALLKAWRDFPTYQRRSDKIAEEAALDGFYIVRTSVRSALLSSEETVACYKRLSKVERAFRCLKTVDLKIRPIFHRLEDRVRAHVFICMLAYYVEWHMRQMLSPVLFEDDDREAAELARRSVVAPAERSESAKAKAKSKRTGDDFPVHSFQTLLSDLATLTKNYVQAKVNGAPMFVQYTTPTRFQQRAFQLLNVSPDRV